MSDNDIQLEMNFSDRNNRFRKTVENGKFTVLFEGPLPEPQVPAAETVNQLKALEDAVLNIDSVKCGLAILDRSRNSEAWSGIEFASHLSEENRDHHVVYLSGRNRNDAEIDRQLVIAANSGNVNIAAVSGDLDDSPEHTDSGIIFKKILKRKDFFSGVTVNPYQYDPWSLTAQYSKLASRAGLNAGFFVAQAGWDILKLQSLSWFLISRAHFVPGFVRIILLTPDKVEKLVAGKQPGVTISRELLRTLEKELCFSRNQFDAAQLRRLKRQVAACKVLGFSGIQLCGAEDPRLAAIAGACISEALNEFKTFDDFLECYHSEMAESEVNSFHLEFQLFDRVLNRPYPFDAPPQPREIPVPEISFWEKLKVKLTPGDKFSGQRQGIATVRNCPKHNGYGPCGGVRHDGKCENGKQECVYRKWVRFAAAADALSSVEKEMI